MPTLEARFNHAKETHKQGKLDEAASAYESILANSPDHASALHLLGVVYLQKQRYTEALSFIDRAIELKNTATTFHNNRGAVLQALNRFPEAKAAFERAIQLRNNYADAWANRGLAENSLDLLDDAERSLRHALDLNPKHPDALMRFGALLRRTDRKKSAAAYYEAAVKGRPKHLDSSIGLAEVYADLKRWDDAQRLFEHALQLAPKNLKLLTRCSAFYDSQGRNSEAKECLRQAASIQPDDQLLQHRHLGVCPSVFQNNQAIDDYWSELNQQLQKATESPPRFSWHEATARGFTPSFNLSHQMRCCRHAKEKFASLFRHAFPHERPKRSKHQRLRIGFVVTGKSEVGFLRSMANIVREMDRERFEPYLFCPAKGMVRCRHKINSDDLQCIELDGPFEEVADRVRQTNCDLLYYWKVASDTLNYFLPMTRPAPVQCTSWGTHGTSGLADIDYYLSSELIESDDADQHYTERLYRLKTLPCFQPRLKPVQRVPRSELGLPSHGAIYFCPHRMPKYHPDFDAILKGILQADATGHIILMTGEHSHSRSMLLSRIKRSLGPELMRRILPIKSLPTQHYFRLLVNVDAVLDSPAYAGGLTAYDAFIHGVPVITLEGPLMVQRYTSGMYRQIGMQQMIATDPDSYIRQAVRIGTDTDYRRSVSDRIRNCHGLLFEDQNVISEFERFLERACQSDMNFTGTPDQ